MRAISINKILLPDKSSVYIKQKQYQVFLGNGTRNYFTALKDAKRFIVETNRFLNDRLHELNLHYVNAFAEYRKLWFYLNDFKTIELNLKESFEFIDRYFGLAVTKGQTTNGNSFVFNYITGIAEKLKYCFSQLAKVLEHKKYFSDLRRVETFTRQIENILFDIDKYGKAVTSEKLSPGESDI